ncbi:MAG: type III-B CRISPR-associated protein Cas10/Cmr2 [Canidatus Methanoxibalbensis ujae]|nr:type III-B CRISPR-associated protein Cas10/Cmr2 [Candidatus Methanoxibalbensis ujae]
MSEFWQDKIKAFLHDPPDKALILFHKSHEKKVADIWENIGLIEDAKRLKDFIEKGKSMREAFPEIHNADVIASSMQRLNIPKDYRMDYAGSCGTHICFRGTLKPVFKHTLSGAVEDFKEVKDFIATYGYEKALKEYGFKPNVVKNFLSENWKKTYFLLWRFLSDQYDLVLPADTRIPDHSILDHFDVTSAIFSLEGGSCLFAVKIPAVQEFIAHSRKLADLWASSHIFSTIIFEGIKVIVEELGPDIIIYPQLRGNPMVDLTEFCGENGSFILHDEGKKLNVLSEDPKERLHIANFPNTFLSFIPLPKASEMADEVEEKIKSKWEEMAEESKKLLKEEAKIPIDEELWDEQIDNAIEITSAWLEFFNFDGFDDVKENIPDDLKERQEGWLNFIEEAERRYKRKSVGHFYSLTYEILSAILMQKSGFWNAWEEGPVTGKKCLMCGRRNALLLRDENGNYKVWNGKDWTNTKNKNSYEPLLKERERLCAVCLVKRLYRDAFRKIFEDAKLPPWESVSEIAARDFIENFSTHPILGKIMEKDIELIYEHEWGESEEKILEEKRNVIEELKKELEKSWKELKNEVKKSYEQLDEKPNKYYAILMMDGDRIGRMLSGETLPNLEEFIHPVFKNKILEYERGEELIKTKRILTPSHHIAISRAMKDFSLYVVPKIVKEHKGFLVYSGGDDVLALFPADKVLDAASEIQKVFKEDFYEIEVNGKKRKVIGLGNKASMSAGIVFAHYKWPLYDAIEKVREAERKAKEKYGRNAFCMTFIKRSGEILTAGGKWDFVADLTYTAKAIVSGKISHRFIYDFMDVSEILEGDMLGAEVRRLLKRRKEEAGDEEIKEIQGKIMCLIEKYDQNLSVKELGNALKILYDAYGGAEG